MRYLSKTAEKVNNKLLALLPMLPPAYRAITPTEVVDVVPVTVEPSSTVIAQQPNSVRLFH